MAFPGGCTTTLPWPGSRPGMPSRRTPSDTSGSSSLSSGSAIRSTSTSSAGRMSIAPGRCSRILKLREVERLAVGLPADVDLGKIVLGRRSEVDGDLETGAGEDLGKVGPELGEHGIAHISARVADRRRELVEGAIGPEHGPGVGRG